MSGDDELQHRLPSAPCSESELEGLGFRPLKVRVVQAPAAVGSEQGSNWDVEGYVPEGPGTYLFTLSAVDLLHVVYAGMTTHLWMVTKGTLPGGAARGGQRYGRPKHAGATRKRINILASEQLQLGVSVQQWVRSADDPYLPLGELQSALRLKEEELITRWNLRIVGWNRG